MANFPEIIKIFLKLALLKQIILLALINSTIKVTLENNNNNKLNTNTSQFLLHMWLKILHFFFLNSIIQKNKCSIIASKNVKVTVMRKDTILQVLYVPIISNGNIQNTDNQCIMMSCHCRC